MGSQSFKVLSDESLKVWKGRSSRCTAACPLRIISPIKFISSQPKQRMSLLLQFSHRRSVPYQTVCGLRTNLCSRSRTVPTRNDVLAPETLLKKRKSQEKARAERAAEAEQKRKVSHFFVLLPPYDHDARHTIN